MAETEFQSTLPAWGATVIAKWMMRLAGISIHAPRVGSDFLAASADGTYTFQSTPPRGERHSSSTLSFHHLLISIHAPRVGSDNKVRSAQRSAGKHFNPRSPRGERLPS